MGTNQELVQGRHEIFRRGQFVDWSAQRHGRPKDGYLYIGMGDGGSGGDPFGNGQNPAALLGKLLRIDPAAYPNIVPADNPYVGLAGDRGEIWASGFRNPFTGRMLPGTSQLFVNDVGSGLYEEVNQIVKGGNFGWPTYNSHADYR